MPHPVVVVGAGPAGLTAALSLVGAGREVLVLEASDSVGGLSQTVEREGWRFDIGGHRFYTKVPEVERLWHELLDEDDFLVRSRLSRIYYRGKFFDYPVRPLNALRNLGLVEALRCVFSYLWARVRPPADQSTLEGYIVANYGRRLYRHFFQTYTEKVWGVPASQLSADWGAQRIKGMSLWGAVWEPLRARLFPGRGGQEQTTSLIEEFRYPRLGPGMMWQRCRDRVLAQGGEVLHRAVVTQVERRDGRAVAVHAEVDGHPRRIPCSDVIASMPLPDLVRAVAPSPPPPVLDAAHRLGFRDFLTVALVIDDAGFPDNWIYVHEPEVLVGRIQNFGRWSPDMVHSGGTCLGLEYFLHEGDTLWSSRDDDLVALATRELDQLGLVDANRVQRGFVVRMRQAYPIYDPGYAERVETLREFLTTDLANVWPVGRNGMHRYNNQDHSMLTGMLAAENALGAAHDIWAVNVEDDYLESGDARTSGGRAAPVVPRPAAAQVGT